MARAAFEGHRMPKLVGSQHPCLRADIILRLLSDPFWRHLWVVLFKLDFNYSLLFVISIFAIGFFLYHHCKTTPRTASGVWPKGRGADPTLNEGLEGEIGAGSEEDVVLYPTGVAGVASPRAWACDGPRMPHGPSSALSRPHAIGVRSTC